MTTLILKIVADVLPEYLELYTERDRARRYGKGDFICVHRGDVTEYYINVDTRRLGRGNIMARAVFLDREAEVDRWVVARGFTGFTVPCVCRGKGRGVSCGEYEVRFEAVKDIPKNEGTRIFYGKLKEWTTDFIYVTEDMVKALDSMDMEPAVLDVNVKRGDRFVVAVPKDQWLKVKKDDGMGHKVLLDDDIMGVNGLQIRIDDVNYLLFGEFFAVDGNLKIYIE